VTPIQFPEASLELGANQPEYLPLPGHIDPNDPWGVMTFAWKLTWRERLKLLVTGVLWHQVLTFKHPLQPQKMLTTKPELKSTTQNKDGE
jgi:hypothetical protein